METNREKTRKDKTLYLTKVYILFEQWSCTCNVGVCVHNSSFYQDLHWRELEKTITFIEKHDSILIPNHFFNLLNAKYLE